MDAFWSLAFPPMCRRPSWLRFGHPLVAACVLFTIYLLQARLNLDRFLRSPWPQLHPYWLATFAALLYLGARLLVRLNLWTIDADEDATPAGWDEAWTAATMALGRSSAAWQSRPMYLAVGETSASLEHLISAGFRPVPEQAPVGISFRVWTREDAIVVCMAERDHEGAGDRSQRFASLVRMMARRTDPRLPFLGIIAFLTLNRLPTLDEAKATGDQLRNDVQCVTDAVGQDAPMVVLVLDAERLPGFEAWAAAQTDEHRMWGVRFAAANDAYPLEPSLEMANAVQAFCNVEGPNEIRSALAWSSTKSSGRRNRELFRLAGALANVGPRLASFVKQMTCAETSDPPPLLGLYLSGTRAEPGSTAFLSGITQVLAQGREHAGWTYRTIEADWTFRRLTRWAMSGMGAAAVVVVAAGLWTLRRF
ncbi:MAG: type VI secretion protein IcmF/TssM N-terminal domain-containing protein [Gemmataceae bacterium]